MEGEKLLGKPIAWILIIVIFQCIGYEALNETNDLSSTPEDPSALVPEFSTPEPDHVSRDRVNNQEDITLFPWIQNETQTAQALQTEAYMVSGDGNGSITVLPHHRDDHHHVHDTDKYTVAKLDFESVSFPFYVTLWLLSACFAKIGMYGIRITTIKSTKMMQYMSVACKV